MYKLHEKDRPHRRTIAKIANLPYNRNAASRTAFLLETGHGVVVARILGVDVAAVQFRLARH